MADRESHDDADDGIEVPDYDDPEGKDYSILQHIDGVRQTLPLRIADYGDDGALTNDQIQVLSDRYGMDARLAEQLSVLLGYSLDVDSHVSFVKITRSKAISQAVSILEEAASLARRIEADSRKVNKLLQPLSPHFATSERAERALTQAKQIATAVEQATHGYSAAIIDTIDKPDAAALMQPDDRRRVRDLRRITVVESCCYIWQDAGHRLTFTTRADGGGDGQREGQLILFLKDVFSMLTDPPTEASGETLRKDIELVRERFKLRGDLRHK